MRASIITPTLNAARWIRSCVENVACQGDVVQEHIVVDGGSSDGTVVLLRELTRVHPRLTWISDHGCGQSMALNTGTQAASGEIVGILNADDHYEPGAVGGAAAILSGIAAPAMVVGDCMIFDDERRFVWNRPDDLRIESLLLGWGSAQFPCNPSAYFYHRDVHRIVGGYDVQDDFAMDLDFVLNCAARVEVRYVPRHWGNFRWAAGGKTFDDRSAPQRRATMLARHSRRLNPDQRAEMERIRQEKAKTRFRPPNEGWPVVAAAAQAGVTLRRGADLPDMTVRLSSLLPAGRGEA